MKFDVTHIRMTAAELGHHWRRAADRAGEHRHLLAAMDRIDRATRHQLDARPWDLEGDDHRMVALPAHAGGTLLRLAS